MRAELRSCDSGKLRGHEDIGLTLEGDRRSDVGERKSIRGGSPRERHHDAGLQAAEQLRLHIDEERKHTPAAQIRITVEGELGH